MTFLSSFKNNRSKQGRAQHFSTLLHFSKKGREPFAKSSDILKEKHLYFKQKAPVFWIKITHVFCEINFRAIFQRPYCFFLFSSQ